MKRVFSLSTILLVCFISFAQKQTYDLLTYTLPEGWQQKEVNGGKQLTVTDNKTGEYAIAMLIQSIVSNVSAHQSFDNYWNTVVKATVTVSEAPTMLDSLNNKGWEILSGYANYTDGTNTGIATLLSASGGGYAMAVVLMTNTAKYQTDITGFINSLELSSTAKSEASHTGSIAGLWVDYGLEKNAYQQCTTGYLRKEYRFNTDSTYEFRKKNFLSNSREIYFVSETGTYTVKGNQLTITPKNGKTEFWSKSKGLKNNEWGSLVRSEKHKLEKITYTFEILEDPNYSNSIILKPGKSTVRDGGQFNAPDDPYQFNYSFRKLESLIDNPPVLRK